MKGPLRPSLFRMHPGRSVITIGNFDGAHLGHAALLRRSVEIASRTHAGAKPRVVALSFDPHPAAILQPDQPPPAKLTTFERRSALLRQLGADEVVKLSPTADLLARSAEDFITEIARDYAPLAFVEGPDFHFGNKRGGNVRVLAKLGSRLGFAVHVVPSVDIPLTDDTIVPASSTIARWLIAQGRVRDAALVLGRPHELEGTVVQGDRRGRTIQFPTANLAALNLIPADGVYAALAVLPDGREWLAAVNVGTRPTFQGHDRRVEAHLIGAQSSDLGITTEYGWPLRLKLVGWLRDQVRFDSTARLVEQLKRDCTRVLALTSQPDATNARLSASSSLLHAHVTTNHADPLRQKAHHA